MKNEILYAALLIIIPMFLVQVAFRLVDRKVKFTVATADKYPFIRRFRFILQTCGALFLVVVVGLLCIAFNLNVWIFYVSAGIITGLINGFFTSLISNEDKI